MQLNRIYDFTMDWVGENNVRPDFRVKNFFFIRPIWSKSNSLFNFWRKPVLSKSVSELHLGGTVHTTQNKWWSRERRALLFTTIFRVSHQTLYVRQAVIFHRSAISHRMAVIAACARGISVAIVLVWKSIALQRTIVVSGAGGGGGGGYLAGYNEDEFLGPSPSPTPSTTLLPIHPNSVLLQNPVILVRLWYRRGWKRIWHDSCIESHYNFFSLKRRDGMELRIRLPSCTLRTHRVFLLSRLCVFTYVINK